MKVNKIIKIWTEGAGRKKTYHCSLIDEKLGSIGEVYVFLWLMELKEAGYIDEIELQPKKLIMAPTVKRKYEKQLKTKIKIVEEHVASDLKYTPDFKVVWNPLAYEANIVIEFDSLVKKESHHVFSFDGVSLIECKPDDLKCREGKDKNMTRLFISKQKAIYHELGIWVNLVFHNALFRDTFIPERYKYSDGMTTIRKIEYKYLDLSKYINRIKINPVIQSELF